MPGGIGDRVQEFLKHYFNCARISARLNHLQVVGFTSHQSLVTSHIGLGFTSHQSLVTSHQSQVTNHESPAASMPDHPDGVRWNCAAIDGKNEFPFRFQLRHWMDTEERSTWMILNELSSPRPRVEVAVPA